MTGGSPQPTAGLPVIVRSELDRLTGHVRGRVLTLGRAPEGLVAVDGGPVRHLGHPGELDGVEPVDTVVSVCELWRSVWTAERLRRLRATLRPGGRVVFVEPVRVTGMSGVVQRLAGPWLRRRLGLGFDRVVLDDLRAAGLVPVQVERLHPGGRGRVVSFVAGVAIPG